MTSYERRYMHVTASRANYATVNPDSQNYSITLYITGWVKRSSISPASLIIQEHECKILFII